jgi:hypothetical protein
VRSAPATIAPLPSESAPARQNGTLLLIAALAMAAVAVSGLNLHQRLRRLRESRLLSEAAP